MRTPAVRLLAMAGAAVLVHGYHLGTDDAEIYVPGIKKAADPSLYPFGSEFFQSHAHLSFFPDLIGGIARVTRVPADWVIFGCHILSIYLLLWAAWRMGCACFENGCARWGAVALLAAVLSTPVAGTALVIMDPYVTARSLSTPALLMAVSDFISNRRKRSLAWLLFTALVHPQMAAYGVVFLAGLEWERRRQPAAMRASVFAMWSGLPFVFEFGPAKGAAREALLSRTYFFLSRWEWYEWLGAIAPLALLWWFSRAAPKGTRPPFRLVARMLVPFGLLFTAIGVVLTWTPLLENYTRLQPMRAFHVVYVVFFIMLGGLLGEFALRKSWWRWLALFVPLTAGMYFAARSAYPFSPQVELPGVAARNNWVDAFVWIRRNTSKDAVFALDPNYMAFPEDDQHGFRAIAERSVLADNVKDSGAVSLFPQLADRWKSQVLAQTGWKDFQLPDFQRLAQAYPVTWVITARPSPAGLTCPYQNRELAVCRIEISRSDANRGHAPSVPQ